MVVIKTARRLRASDRPKNVADGFRAILSGNSDAIVVLDHEGCFLYANPAAEALFDMSSDDLAGALFGFPPALGEPVRLTLLHRHNDSSIEAEMSVVDVVWAGEPCHLLSFRETTGRTPADQVVNLPRDRIEALVNRWKRANEEMPVREIWLRHFSHAYHIGFFEWSECRGRFYTIPETFEWLGYDFDSSITMEEWLSKVHPDDREMVRRRFADDCEIGRCQPCFSSQIEYRMVRDDGKVVWLESLSTFALEGGDLIMRGASRDITESKQIAEVLRVSEAKYRHLVENANSIILSWDLEGNLMFFNEFAEEFFGYRAGEVLGKNVVNTIVPASDSAGRDLAAMIKDIGLNPEHHTSNANENVRRNGQRVWISWTNKAILDAQGNVVGIQSVGNDITERKRAEEALRVSEERLHRACCAGGVGLFEWNVDRDTAYLSPEAYELYGLSQGSPITYKKWFERVHPDDREMTERTVAETSDKARDILSISIRLEYRTLHPDGAVLWLLITGTCNIECGDLIVRGAVRDITERKRAEEALANAKAQAELYVDLMGHDINNFNQMARGYLELMDGMVEDEKLKELITKPVAAIESSSRLIKNVQKLQLARSGGPRMEILDVGALIEEVARQSRSIPGCKSVDIKCDVVRGMKVQANELLRDVFVNLVSNAIKHSPGDSAIDIRAMPEQKDGQSYCKVTIDDNGPGIADDMKVKVFDRLRRGDTKAKGSGLGLYLVKSLVGCYGGRVWVEDRVKGDHTKGARFVVMLPSAENNL